MDAVEQNDLQTARELFEQALDSGINTHESLLYNYALLLVMLDEQPQQVDRAVARWTRFFPKSELPDPRKVAAVRPER